MKRLLLVLAGTLFVGAAFAASLTDGSYSGAFDAMNPFGWKPQMTVVVKGGKIASVDFVYVDKKGNPNTKDAYYNKTMKAQSGTNPETAYPELAKKLIAKQQTPVDGVTGATESSSTFNALAAALLAKAAKGDKTPAVLPMNATYVVEGKPMQDGYKGRLSVTFENGKIVKADYDELSKDGKSKKGNAGYGKMMKAKTKVSPTEAYTKLVDSLVATQDPAKVDAVTGATEDTTYFKELAKQLMSMR